MILKMGGRKVFVSVLILTMGVVLDKFSSSGLSNNMLTLLLGVVGSFTAGNIGTHFIQNKWANSSQIQSKNDSISSIQDEINTLNASMNQLKEAASLNAQALNFLVQYVKSVQI